MEIEYVQIKIEETQNNSKEQIQRIVNLDSKFSKIDFKQFRKKANKILKRSS